MHPRWIVLYWLCAGKIYSEMLEILDSKSYGSEIKYTIMKESGDIDPRLFLIPSRIVITDTSGFMGQKFTIMAKEDPTMHLSQGLQTK